jgi:hypothetical protein
MAIVFKSWEWTGPSKIFDGVKNRDIQAEGGEGAE